MIEVIALPGNPHVNFLIDNVSFVSWMSYFLKSRQKYIYIYATWKKTYFLAPLVTAADPLTMIFVQSEDNNQTYKKIIRGDFHFPDQISEG